MSIFIPRWEKFRRRKPADAVLNENHDAAQDLVGYWLMDDLNKDLTGNNNGSDVGTISRSTHDGEYYSHISSDNTADRINLGSIPSTNPISCSAHNEISIIAGIDNTRNSSYHGNVFPRIIDKSDGGSAANGWALYPRVSDGDMSIEIAGSNYIWESDTSKDFLIVCATHASNTARAFEDGNFIGSSSLPNNLPTATTNAAIGNWNHSTDRQFRAPIYFVGVYDKKISDELARELTTFPYQVLKPKRKYWMLGGTVSESSSTELLTTVQTMDRGVQIAASSRLGGVLQ